jgi:hypothetical protein
VLKYALGTDRRFVFPSKPDRDFDLRSALMIIHEEWTPPPNLREWKRKHISSLIM